ncbi:acyl-CoA-binding protein [Schizophyllum amplum]|uniref:Acyl-CoA-binding protein n=1 Tax=Schizophyllum amplum TaxID=97359 RepID=A0A550CHK9_9AGAR|nr:acyl-CoA-binding protein [Auriculariopsis ampla]
MSESKFTKAVEIIGSLPKDGPIKPTQDEQLFFYKYFKQAKVGDNTTTRPGMLDFTGKAKWDAWTEVKGTTADEARDKYVKKLLEILERAGDEQSKKFIAEIEAA